MYCPLPPEQLKTLATIDADLASQISQADVMLADPLAVTTRLLRALEAGGSEVVQPLVDMTLLRAVLLTLDISPYLAEFLIRQPDHLKWLATSLPHRWSRHDLYTHLEGSLGDDASASEDLATQFDILRDFHLAHLLRIGMADISDLANLEEVVKELSDLADVTVEAVRRRHWAALVEEHGQRNSKGGDEYQDWARGTGGRRLCRTDRSTHFRWRRHFVSRSRYAKYYGEVENDGCRTEWRPRGPS